MRLRLTIGDLLNLVVVCGLVFALARIPEAHFNAFVWPLARAGVCGFFACALGRLVRVRLGRRLLLGWTIVALGAATYVVWAEYRASAVVWEDDAGWPRVWPYPDGAIVALNAYFDARYPAPPGSIKLHGELPRVRDTLSILSACLSLVAGLGLAWLRRGGTGER